MRELFGPGKRERRHRRPRAGRGTRRGWRYRRWRGHRGVFLLAPAGGDYAEQAWHIGSPTAGAALNPSHGRFGPSGNDLVAAAQPAVAAPPFAAVPRTVTPVHCSYSAVTAAMSSWPSPWAWAAS